MPFLLPPFLLLVLGALTLPLFTARPVRAGLALAFAILSLCNLMAIPEGIHFVLPFLGQEVILAKVDKLSFLFGLIFHLAAIFGIVYAWESKDNTERVFAMLYAAAAQGVVFAGDMLSLFLFWESLTVCAAVIIWTRGDTMARGAGFRYFLVHAVGGLLLLAGIVLRVHHTGSLAFGPIGLDSPGGLLIFLGFGVNAAWPLLHAWLPDAYPNASPTGTVFLSAFTTKGAVYVLARSFAGEETLIWIGAIMAVFPLLYAMIENDLRRTLAWCLINQVGFMMIGVGIGSELAINGVCAHAFVHILYKALLFMSAGAVLAKAGTCEATKLASMGGLARQMPWTFAFACAGVASISVPLFCGFAGKSLIISATAEAHLSGVWMVLMFASAGVFLAGLRVLYVTFGQPSAPTSYQGLTVSEAPWGMRVGMALTAGASLLVGFFPSAFYSLLPNVMDYHLYSAGHLVSQFQVLFFTGLAFLVMQRAGLLPAEIKGINLDVDILYRRLALLFYAAMDSLFNRFNAWCEALVVDGLFAWLARVHDQAPWRFATWLLSPVLLVMPKDVRDGIRAEIRPALETATTPIGLTAFMTVAFLCVSIIMLLTA
ncbi:MAG: Na(+)/H(+) antiporter subunit D [Desulfovibrio sp.]|nr:Na(+)/H(+) antiporter subunit D [Desulfovibrio sp.]